jgi:pimeloyl-ACP methyl ester carboxylesterase
MPSRAARPSLAMLPAEIHLEVRSHLPARANGNSRRSDARSGNANRKPPLLFVHGGYCDSWCWDPYFLSWFAEQGYPSHALSLRGHGQSGGGGTLFVAGLDDYAADVEKVAATLGSPPVMIGHSMGAAVVERLIATRPVRAAALLAPLPPSGLLPMAARLATERPDYLMQMAMLDPSRLTAHVLETLRPFYFDDVEPSILYEATRHLGVESPRALLDLSLRLHWQLPERGVTPVLVLGVAGDRICTPEDVHATARHHGVDAVVLPGLAHMMMLERRWEEPARVLLRWLSGL